MTRRGHKNSFRMAAKCPRCKHFEFEHGMNGCLVNVGNRSCNCQHSQTALAAQREETSARDTADLRRMPKAGASRRK